MNSHHRSRSDLLNSGGEEDEAASGRVDARAEGVESSAGGMNACQYDIADIHASARVSSESREELTSVKLERTRTGL